MKGLSHGPRHWVGVGKEYSFCSSFRCEKNLERYVRFKEPCLPSSLARALKPCYLSLMLPRRLLRRLGASDCLHLFAVPALSSHHPALISVQTSLKCFSVGSVSSALQNAPTFGSVLFVVSCIQGSITSHWSLLQLTITQNLTLVLILCMSSHFLNTCQERNLK